MTFEDVMVFLSRAEWDALPVGQRELYRDVVADTYELLTSLGNAGNHPGQGFPQIPPQAPRALNSRIPEWLRVENALEMAESSCSPALPRPPLIHVSKCCIHTVVQSFQGWTTPPLRSFPLQGLIREFSAGKSRIWG